jgi:phage terminase small subunit
MEQNMDAHFEKINASFEEMRANMDAYYEGMIVIIKECLGRTEAKKESAPEETEAVAEPQEVPEGATDEEAIGVTEDRSRNLRLAVGCRRANTMVDSGRSVPPPSDGRPVIPFL